MTLVDTIIKTAKAQVGYQEGRANGHWDNAEKFAAEVPGLAWVSTEGQPWCAVFVSWVALKSGAAALYPSTASTDAGASWFKARGQWSEYPVRGAQVFYGVNGDMNHTGLVYDFDATYIYTVEGNTNTSGSSEGDGVYLKKRVRKSSTVQGYGHPKFPAVPAPAPKPVVKPTPAPAPKPAAKHVYPAKLAASVKPGRFGASELQRALIATGYAKGVFTKVTGYYGGGTQKAVRAFFNAHPEFASSETDVAIGAKGWTYLAAKAGK